MASLGDELLRACDEIVQRWYETWRESSHPHCELSEAVLKDRVPKQLEIIAEQLKEMACAERPAEMWKVSERLQPEERVLQEIPIEEVVQEYGLLVDTIRNWIDEQNIQVSFHEYSYLFHAIFELAAESVRRYARYEAERIAQDRAEYLAGVTHQMRAPVTALSLQIEMLERSGKPPESKALDRLRRSVARLSRLASGVLRLERFKPDQLPVQPRAVYPAELFQQVVDDVQPEATTKGLRLEVVVDEALEMNVDPDLFLDTAGNLVHNAVRYTDSGFVRVEVDVHSDDVLFRVRDSGPGIAPDRQMALFKPVQSAKHGGTGIGLMIAHHAVVAQGGTIGVESTPGKGTCFWFRLARDVTPRERGPEDEG